MSGSYVSDGLQNSSGNLYLHFAPVHHYKVNLYENYFSIYGLGSDQRYDRVPSTGTDSGFFYFCHLKD